MLGLVIGCLSKVCFAVSFCFFTPCSSIWCVTDTVYFRLHDLFCQRYACLLQHLLRYHTLILSHVVDDCFRADSLVHEAELLRHFSCPAETYESRKHTLLSLWTVLHSHCEHKSPPTFETVVGADVMRYSSKSANTR